MLDDLIEDVLESVLMRLLEDLLDDEPELMMLPAPSSFVDVVGVPGEAGVPGWPVVWRLSVSVWSSRSSSSFISGLLTSLGLPEPNMLLRLLSDGGSTTAAVSTGFVRGNSTSGLRPSATLDAAVDADCWSSDGFESSESLVLFDWPLIRFKFKAIK